MTQPVPPIFEPEVTAQVVVTAGYADRPRREYWVGMPTVAAILGQEVRITISDNGHGMNDIALCQIFEPFFHHKRLCRKRAGAVGK